jgi:hypothetical protein
MPRVCAGIFNSNESRTWQDGEVKSAAPIQRYKKSPLDLLVDYWSTSGKVMRSTLNVARPDLEILKSACDDLPRAEQAACRATPNAFFGIDRTVVVDSVQKVEQRLIDGEVRQIRQTASIGTEFNQSDRYATGKRDSEQFLQSYAAKLGFERFGNGFQFTAAYNRLNDLFHVTELVANQEEKASAVVDDYTVLTSEELRVPMHVTLKTCLVVHPQPAIADAVGVKLDCGNAVERSVTESWFQVRDRQHPLGSAHLDPNDIRLRGWAKLIRGEQSYADFKRAMEDRTRMFRFQKVGSIENYLSAEDRAREATRAEDGGLFPGILSLKSTGGPKWTLQQRQKSVRTCAETALSHEILDDARSDRAIAACGCLYDVISRQWEFEDYTREWKKKLASLETSGWKKRCVRFAERSVR